MSDEPKVEGGTPAELQQDPRELMKRLSRRGFLWAGASILGTYGAYRWLDSRPGVDGLTEAKRKYFDQPWPQREAFELNEKVARAFGQGDARTRSAGDISKDARVNGGDGLAEVPLKDWRLHIEGIDQPRVLTIEEIRAMPASEMIAELNCIEGWTRVIRWRGVRMTDLLAQLGQDPKKLPEYLALETPKRGYYVGLEKSAAIHPQSLLAYEIDGIPLSDGHGAPLRHVLPIKYGYKQLKHIGLLRFQDKRPADFWTEQGYDWYGGF
jgi:DMSO/TMAO reductase YedYZ molybdopterin-dependent catalytic subunit